MNFGNARLIAADEVLDSISPQRAMAAVERALVAMARGAVLEPKAMAERVPDGTFHVKTCAGAGGEFAALFVAKLNSNFPDNPAKHGLPTIQGALLAFDTRCGRLLAVIDSGSVTNLRTAATTAVALRHLAREGASVATVIGCGAQGKAHLRMLAHVLPMEKVFLHDLDPAHAQSLAGWARQARLPFEVAVVADFQSATRQSDVVVTCTASSTPFLEAHHVKAGTVVAAVGADNERKAEIAESLLETARIVTDHTAQCLKSGDLRRLAAREHDWQELAQVVLNGSGRVRQDEVVVFDSTGLAVEDLAIVAELLGNSEKEAGMDRNAVGLMAAAAVAVSAQAEVVDFDKDAPGAVPAGWTAGVTGKGAPRWTVEADPTAPSPSQVLKQSGKGDFPWCVRKAASLADGFVEVKFKPLTGREDQAGGVVWRWKDGDNYYVARANALEDNVSLYYTEGGRRKTIKYVDAPVARNQWHVLRVEFQGVKIRVILDGKAYISVDDSHIAGTGAVGVWTKADSVTLFDDFSHGPTAR